MNLRDQLSGFFWLAISIFVCLQSIWMEVGTFHSPGTGFLPFWSGLALGTFSIILISTSILERKGERKVMDLWKGIEWSNVLSFHVCHLSKPSRLSHHDIWSDGCFVWPQKRAKALDSGSACPYYFSNHLCDFPFLAWRSTT